MTFKSELAFALASTPNNKMTLRVHLRQHASGEVPAATPQGLGFWPQAPRAGTVRRWR
jgi:hypothetical protein